jgi:hypothetical protein
MSWKNYAPLILFGMLTKCESNTINHGTVKNHRPMQLFRSLEVDLIEAMGFIRFAFDFANDVHQFIGF